MLVAMSAVDGKFERKTIQPTAEIDRRPALSFATSSAPSGAGRGDSLGNWGPVSAAFLDVIHPATAPIVQGTVRDISSGSPLAATVDVGPFPTAPTPAGFTRSRSRRGRYHLTATAADHAAHRRGTSSRRASRRGRSTSS